MPEDLSGREGVAHNNATYHRGCRCAECRADHAWVQADGVVRRRMRLAELPPSAHGHMGTYANWGCRCGACVEASSEYHRERRALKKAAAHEASLASAATVDQPQSEMVCDLGFTHIVVS